MEKVEHMVAAVAVAVVTTEHVAGALLLHISEARAGAVAGAQGMSRPQLNLQHGESGQG